jgi:hypothetical protein
MVKRRLIIVGAFLLVPLVAMQFSDQFNWGIEDFVFAGIWMYCLLWLVEFSVKKFGTRPRKLIIPALIILVFLAIWAELAVGLFN